MDRHDRLQGLFLAVPLLVAFSGVGVLWRFVFPAFAEALGIANVDAVPPEKLGELLVLLACVFAAFCLFLYLGYVVAAILARRRYPATEIWRAVGSPIGMQWSNSIVKRLLSPFVERRERE